MGKSGMTAGAGTIENGVLDARIIKREMTQPIETILADRDVECVEKDSIGRLWVGKYTGVSVYDGSGWLFPIPSFVLTMAHGPTSAVTTDIP